MIQFHTSGVVSDGEVIILGALNRGQSKNFSFQKNWQKQKKSEEL